MESQDFCLDLRTTTACSSQLSLVPDPNMPFAHMIQDPIFIEIFNSNLATTHCWTPLVQLTDGGYGYDLGQATTGALVPNITSSGIIIYSTKFYSNGDFIISFGATGNEKLNNSSKIYYKFANNEYVLLVWDTLSLTYSGSDLQSATDILNGNLGIDTCFEALAVPDLLIHFDFGAIL